MALLGITACGSNLELVTTKPVDVMLLPMRVGAEGQRLVGTIPAGVTVPVKNSVLAKDGTAYEVEYRNTPSKNEIKGYVLLGSPGLTVREKS